MVRRFRTYACKSVSVTAAALTLCCCQSQGSDVLRYEAVNVGSVPPGLALDAKQPSAPLGSADRIVIRNGHFFTVGTSGAPSTSTRVRFFGVSLALAANFPSETDGEALARRLAALGVNIVRLHAIDQPAQNSASGPVGMLRDAASPQLDQQAVVALSRLINQLGQHGIYVDLNLHANHTFPATHAGDRIPSQSKPLPIFDVDMMAWQATYTKNLLSALKLRDSPNLAMVEINNESTLVDNWQEGTLPSLVTGRFRYTLQEKWAAYRKDRRLAPAPLPLERSGLSRDDSRVAAGFYIDLDQRYIGQMVGVVRDQLGVDVPISGTQIIHSGRWNHGGFANFDVNSAASFTDAHFYIDHYLFPNRQWDWNDWRISNGWLGNSPEQTLLNTAFARVAGRPFLISEFNQAWPNQQASDLLPVVTQFAVSQDWDGLILYDYAHDREWNAFTPSDFSLRGDITKLAQFAQCSAYFRAMYPGTALTQSFIALSPDDRAMADGSGIVGNLASYLSKHFGIPPSVAMTRQIALENAPNFGVRSAVPAETSSYFLYDQAALQFTFGSAYAAGVSGFIPVGHRVKSSLLELTLAPGSRGFATAFLTSLDGTPLSDSRRLLLSIPGFTMGTDTRGTQQLDAADLRGHWRTILPREGHLPSASLYKVAGPAQMERIPATVSLQLPVSRVSVFALDIQGRRLRPIASRTDGQHVVFDINRDGQPFAANYEITVER
ncbi:Cellulase (glycosyl hydrolase family 5) [Burkholderia sp. GAS332]|nr:Cellulase (glycosyl hydrolase family 5) [Burkholderia sp. GAS332]